MRRKTIALIASVLAPSAIVGIFIIERFNHHIVVIIGCYIGIILLIAYLILFGITIYKWIMFK